MPAAASTGWTGSNQVMAPLEPRAISTSLLQVGQPMAKNARSPPKVNERASSVDASASVVWPTAGVART